MSLLINALRKRQQQTATQSGLQNAGELPARQRLSKKKWSAIIVLVLLVIVLLTLTSVKLLQKPTTVNVDIKEEVQPPPIVLQEEQPVAAPLAVVEETSAAPPEEVPPVAAEEEAPATEVSTTEAPPAVEQPAEEAEQPAAEPAPEPEPAPAPMPKADIQKVSVQDASMHTEYQQAKAMIEKLDYAGAIKLLDNQTLAIDTKGESAVLLGDLYLQQNKLEEAKSYLAGAILYHTAAQVKLISLLGETYFRQADYQSAIALLNQASPPLSEYPSYYTLLARAYLSANEPQAALEILQQVVAIFPSNGSYWVALGLSYQKAGDSDSAVVAYNKAAELNDDNPQALLFINQQLRFLQS